MFAKGGMALIDAIQIIGGTAAVSGATPSTDSQSGLRPALPDSAPSRDGLRQRTTTRLPDLNSTNIREIKTLANDEIEMTNFFNDMRAAPRTQIVADLYTDLDDFPDLDLEDVDLDPYNPNIPLVLPEPGQPPRRMPTRRQRFFRRFLISTGVGGLPIGSATVLAVLLTQNRNSATAGAVAQSGNVNDCPDGPSFTGPFNDISLNGLNRCNYRKIFTRCLVFLLDVIHQQRPYGPQYWNWMFDAIFNDQKVQTYFFTYDKRLQAQPNPVNETTIYQSILTYLEGKKQDDFSTAIRVRDKQFVDKWFNIESLLTKLTSSSTVDPDFAFFLKTLNFEFSTFVARIKISLLGKSDWPWILANELSQSNGDVGLLKNTPQYVIWKEVVKLQFDVDSVHLLEYYLNSLPGSGKINNKLVYQSMREALKELCPSLQANFPQRFCEEFFAVNFERCLGKMETVFEPSSENFPPFFDPTLTITQRIINDEFEIPSEDLLMHDVGKLIMQWFSKTDDRTNKNIPQLTNQNHALFTNGVVVRKSSVEVYIFYKNAAYIGLLHLIDKDAFVGYIKTSPEMVLPWIPNSPFEDVCIFQTRFVPLLKSTMSTAVAVVPQAHASNLTLFDYQTMELRESDQLYSMLAATWKLSSGLVVNSYNFIENRTMSSAVAVYQYAESGAVYVYEAGKNIASGSIQVLQLSFYVALAFFGLYGLSIVGPGLQEMNKKRKRN